jgi:hypothetical protein
MRRLRQQIYLTIVASLILVVLIAGAIWRFSAPSRPQADAFGMASEFVAAALPPPDAPPAVQDDALRELAARLRTDLALFDADAADRRRRPPAARPTGASKADRGAIRRPSPSPSDRRGWYDPRGPAGTRSSVSSCLSVDAGSRRWRYPLVRRLTRRLSGLRAGVETRFRQSRRPRSGRGQ